MSEEIKNQPAADTLKIFVDDVVSLTKSEQKDVERFAKEYLTPYVEYLQQSKSDDQDERIRGQRMIGHIRAQVALRAGIYGVKLEQSMLAALWKLFDAALGSV